MNLDYKILWFEDDKTSYEERKEVIQEFVEELGFNFIEPTHEIDHSNLENLRLEDYDLMLVDFNLAQNEKGTDIINAIRNKGVLTDVVFYSSAGERIIREELHQNEIEGCYCSSRDIEPFERKVKKIIETTVKKVQDINNMRGLIMAETSDLDELMVEIIECFIKSNSEKDAFILHVFTEVNKKINEKNKKFNNFFNSTPKKMDKLMKESILFDNATKLEAIQYIINHLKLEKLKSFNTDYGTDVSGVRNIFAHVSIIEEDGIKKLKSKNKEIPFTDKYCKDVREDLKKYTGILEDLKANTCQ